MALGRLDVEKMGAADSCVIRTFVRIWKMPGILSLSMKNSGCVPCPALDFSKSRLELVRPGQSHGLHPGAAANLRATEHENGTLGRQNIQVRHGLHTPAATSEPRVMN